MLGFLPLSTEPLSSVIAEIVRLESSAQLDSLSIFNASLYGKFFSLTEFINISEVSALSKIVSYLDSSINSPANFELQPLIKIPSDFIFVNSAQTSFSELIKIQNAKTLDVITTTDFNSYIKSKIDSNLISESNLQLFAKLTFQQSSTLDNFGQFQTVGKLITPVDSDLISEAELFVTYLNRVVANSINESNFNLESNGLIKLYPDAQFNNESYFYSSLGALYRGDSRFEVVGILSSNLSQRNRDIVYYILAINREEPFELKILRSK